MSETKLTEAVFKNWKQNDILDTFKFQNSNTLKTPVFGIGTVF